MFICQIRLLLLIIEHFADAPPSSKLVLVKKTKFGTEVFSASPTYKISFRGTVKECEKVLGYDRIWSSRTKSKIINCLDGKYTWKRK